MTALTRYWIEFDASVAELPSGVRLGVGVTAAGRDDALGLVAERVFDGELPPITKLIENVDVSALDLGRVLPNMEPPLRRAVWFPRGFA